MSRESRWNGCNECLALCLHIMCSVVIRNLVYRFISRLQASNNSLVMSIQSSSLVLYNTNFSRGGNFRYIREFGFCAKFSSHENNIHCEWNFAPAKFSSPRKFNSISGLLYKASIICNKNGAFVHITNSSLIIGITAFVPWSNHPD